METEEGTAPNKMTMAQLRSWLDEQGVETPSSIKRKQTLVEMVEEKMASANLASVNQSSRRSGEFSREENEIVDPESMTVAQLKQWLSDHGADMPPAKAKKALYVQMVEEVVRSSLSVSRSKTPEPLSKKATFTPKKETRSARKATPSRSSRRIQLIARPRAESEDDEGESEVDGDAVTDDTGEEDGEVRIEASSTIAPKGRSCMGRVLRAYLVGMLFAAVMYAYFWWGYVQFSGVNPLADDSL